jgi:hypothetical protein
VLCIELRIACVQLVAKLIRVMNRLFARPLYILATAYVALGLIYAWATPPFEASDEYWHFGMLEYIHVNHAF